MAFTRERSDADWYRGLKVPQAVVRNIDEKTKKAVSATGGSYAPASAINIGGAGLELQAAVRIPGAVSSTFYPGAGKNFIFGDDDYFENVSLVSRVIDTSPLSLLGHHNLQREARILMATALGSTTPALRTRRAGAFVRMPLRIPDGALLSSVEIGFKVGQSHANVPATLPSARVVRLKYDGTVEQHPNPSSAVYEIDGWVFFPAPASGALWYNGGAIQTLTLSYDYANTEEADSSLYGYAVEWREEEGGNAFADSIGNLILHLRATVYQRDLRPY